MLALGPIEVWNGGRQVALGGPKPKTLLVALLLQPGQVVPVERLIDMIWDESPPQSAGALVHTYVSALRREAGRALVTRAPGYVLDVEYSDVEEFMRHVSLARQAERDGDPATACRHYEQGLALWRGPALHGIEASFARGQALALEETRLSAEEGLGRCELAQGRFEDAIGRLSALAHSHPAREDTRVLLMSALYRAGRQADALDVYREARTHLHDELGIEPGEKLQQMHRQLLVGVLEAPPAVVTPPVRDVVLVPHHLPPDISDFTGRKDALRQVLAVADAPANTTSTPTVVISGFGGVGKSALAVRATHLLRRHYADGQLFADLRGAERDLQSHEVLGRFLGLLGVPGKDQPDGIDERVELYRRLVTDRKLVIVLDNARSERQVRSLLPGNPNCFVIITSRSRLTGLEGAEPVELDLLQPDVSAEMLSRIVGHQRVDREPEAARHIVELCGGVPLALRAAAAKLLARPHWPLRMLAQRLSDERRRLDELTVGDLAIRSSLGLNYAELDEPHRTAFHLLALLDLPDFGAWVAAPLLGVDVVEAEDVVEHLVELRLLDVVGVDHLGRVRYRFHDLVQLYGAEQAPLGDDVTAAVGRLLATWVVLVEAGTKDLPRVTRGLAPRLGREEQVDPRLVEEVEQNPTGWQHSETAAVVRAVERAHDLGVDENALTLITSLLSSSFSAHNEFDGWQRTHDVALRAARARGNRAAEAVVLTGLGKLRYEQDDFDAALANFQQAADGAELVEDDATLAVALVGLGTVYRDLASFTLARSMLDRAVVLGDDEVVAAAAYGLGAIHRDLGDIAAAEASLERSLSFYRQFGDQRGTALALRGISLCHRASGEFLKAVDLSREAVALLRAADDELGVVYAKQSLVKASLRAGLFDGLDELLAECAEVCDRKRDRFGLALMARTRGELALALGRPDAAALLSQALVLWTELGAPLWRARTMRDLAAATRNEETWAAALELFRSLGVREADELAGMTAAEWLSSTRVLPVQTPRAPSGMDIRVKSRSGGDYPSQGD